MPPLSTQAVEIDSRTKGLVVEDWTIRQSRKEDAEDSGWRFQAILRNQASAALKEIESELRYFDSAGKFLGVDEGFLVSNELGRRADRAVSITLTVPPGTSRAVFCIKGKRENILEKHGFLLFGAALVISAVLFTFGRVIIK